MIRSKKRLNKYFLLLLLLGVTVGFALLSTTLKINGTAGVKGSVYDIHWENVQPNANSTVEATIPQISENATKVAYDVTLELPGDFYEYTVDAKNDGTVNGEITKIEHSIRQVTVENEQEIETETTLPDYIKYTVYYDGTTTKPKLGDVLNAGEAKTYRVRIEFDKESTILPENDLTYRIEDEITYTQTRKEDDSPYIITLDPNGGIVNPTTIEVPRGQQIGALPLPTNGNVPFGGWFDYGQVIQKITSTTTPVGNMTIHAQWPEPDSFAIFDTGTSVNTKIKGLAGDDVSGTNPYTVSDTAITSVVRSSTAPASGTTTENVAQAGSEEILAWYENGTIKLYSAAEELYLNSDASNMFYNLTNATSLYTGFKTSNTTNMAYLFAGVKATSFDLSTFDTSNVTNMSTMFAGTKATTIDLSNFDTGNVTNMQSMFIASSFTSLDLSNFNTANVTDMSGMFSNSKVRNLDLTDFDVSKVSSLGGIISGSDVKNIDISGWDFKGTTSLAGVFSGATKLETINLDNVNTSNITNMGGMFSGDSSLTSLDLSDFDISNVSSSNLGGMLGGCSSLEELDFSNWNFTNYNMDSLMMYMTSGGLSSLKTLVFDNAIFNSSMSYAFGGLSSVETISFKNTDTSNVTNMSSMFNGDSSIEILNLASFDTKNVTNMGAMFNGMSSITTIKVSDDFIVDQVTSSGGMFYNDNNLVGGKGTTYDPDHIDKEYAHYDGGESDPGYFDKAVVVNYTVTFNPNGGSVDPTTKSVEGGEKIGELPTPTKAGASYTGWYTDPTCGNKITSNTRITSDITVYAHWIPNIEVIYNGNNGEFNNNTTNPVTYRYNSNTDKYSGNGYAIPTRSGYVFAGWNTRSDGNGITYKDVDEVIEGIENFTTNNNLYAMWTKEHTINFNANGGTVSEASRKVVDGNSLGVLPIPTNGNTPFAGWYTDITGGVEVTGSTIPTTNATYYARWATSYATFDTGTNVAVKFKTLAGDTINTNYPESTQDTNVTSIVRSNTAPGAGITTENVEATGSTPIIAWYDNGTIYYYTSATYIFLNSDASYMFAYFENLTNVDLSFKKSNITNVSHMFYHCSSLTSLDLSSFNTSNVTNMEYITLDCPSLVTVNFSNWDFRNYNVGDLASKLGLYSGSVSSLKTAIFDNCIFQQNMTQAFHNMSIENISLKNVDTSNATTMYELFDYSTKIKKLDLTSFNTSNVTNMSYMFSWMDSLEEVDVSSFDTSKVTNMNEMFYQCPKLKSLDLSNFDTSHIYEAQAGGMYYMFAQSGIETLNISNFDLRFFDDSSAGGRGNLFYYFFSLAKSNVKCLIADNVILPAKSEYAFYDFTNLEYLSLRGIDTSRVTSMVDFFYYDSKLKEIDISDFNTNNVTDMYSMFGGMSELTTIIEDNNFKIGSAIASDRELFYNNPKLVGGAGTTYDSNHRYRDYAHIDGGPSNPGYFTSARATCSIYKFYNIRFNANGGTSNPTSLSVRPGRTIIYLPTPTKEGYTFLGWYTGLTDGTLVGVGYMPSSNMTLYARWTPNS